MSPPRHVAKRRLHRSAPYRSHTFAHAAAPPITWAKSPPAATKKRTPLPKPPPPPPTNYTTETKAAYKSSTDASTPSRGDFMERLEQAERADVNSKNARMALIPRVA